jgi:hypothetical protein
MRTTLDIDDDVLLAAKELAKREKKTVGKLVSELARKGLIQPKKIQRSAKNSFLGFDPFPHRGSVVTNKTINDIREAEGIE